MEKVDFSASFVLYPDDPVDKVILEWLDSLPKREEAGGARARVCRRGLGREVRQALFAYAKKQLGSAETAKLGSHRRRTAPASAGSAPAASAAASLSSGGAVRVPTGSAAPALRGGPPGALGGAPPTSASPAGSNQGQPEVGAGRGGVRVQF